MRRVGIDHEQDDVPNATKSLLHLVVRTEEEFLQSIKDAANADVVGDAAIDQVNVGPVCTVPEVFHTLVAL